MLFYASLIGGWEKLELWGHSHLALLGLLFLTCVSEVILFKLTIFTGLFFRGHFYNPEYNDTEEHEEDIYYEDLNRNYDQWARRELHLNQMQQREEQQIVYHYNNHYNSFSNPFLNSSTTTGIFRFVY